MFASSFYPSARPPPSQDPDPNSSPEPSPNPNPNQTWAVRLSESGRRGRLLSEAGSTGFLLWRSVYVVKQVSPRTRFLVLFDWLKTKIFGRDVTSW